MWMKKRYILRHGPEQFTVTLAEDQSKLAVQIDEGEMQEVDAHFVQNGRALSLRCDGRMYLVDLTARDNKGKMEATVGGRPLRVSVMDELHAMALDSLGSGGGSGVVEAEIPGLVVALNCKEGKKVHQGEALLVLEAMKMQNEIPAPVGGTIEEIKVAEGDSVNSGDVLVVIEPLAGG